jgi:hypothetical protein
VYQSQKVHLFRPNLSFLAEAQPRLENRRGQKRSLEKLQVYFVSIFFKYVHIYYILINIFFANKTRNLLIYIIYGDRTTIGFVGFVANLLNRLTDGATVSVRKRVTFRPLLST